MSHIIHIMKYVSKCQINRFVLCVCLVSTCFYNVFSQVWRPISKQETPHNWIVFLPLGCSDNTLTLTRLMHGKPLTLDAYQGGCVTASASNHLVADEAAAGTALACAHITSLGMIGLSSDAKPLTSITETAQQANRLILFVSDNETPGLFMAPWLLHSDVTPTQESIHQTIQQTPSITYIYKPLLVDAIRDAFVHISGQPDRPFLLVVSTDTILEANRRHDPLEAVKATLIADQAFQLLLEGCTKRQDTAIIATAAIDVGGLQFVTDVPAYNVLRKVDSSLTKLYNALPHEANIAEIGAACQIHLGIIPSKKTLNQLHATLDNEQAFNNILNQTLFLLTYRATGTVSGSVPLWTFNLPACRGALSLVNVGQILQKALSKVKP